MSNELPPVEQRPELLPCPFCGEDASLHSPRFPIAADCDDAQVICGHCDAAGPAILCDMSDADAQSHWPAACSKAIASWNQRPTPASAGDAGEKIGARTRASLERIAASESEPGSHRNMMLRPCDAKIILAALNPAAQAPDAGEVVAKDGDIKAIWRKHGGAQHGPIVEQYYIEERAFYRFARDLLASYAHPPATPDHSERIANRMGATFRMPTVEQVADDVASALSATPEPGQVDKLREALELVRGAMMRDGSGSIMDMGWNITLLNKARPAIHEALAPGDHPSERALNGYRAAISYLAADSWDGCSDCIEVLRAARTADVEWDWAGDPNRIAAELKLIRQFSGRTDHLPSGEAAGGEE